MKRRSRLAVLRGDLAFSVGTLLGAWGFLIVPYVMPRSFQPSQPSPSPTSAPVASPQSSPTSTPQ